MMDIETDRLMLPEEVAQRLQVKLSWVYMAARQKILPSVKMGRWVRFKESDVEAFIAKGGQSA